MAATLAADGFLSFLIVGKTGYGKSATGNSIIGQKNEFKAQKTFSSTTKTCQREVARVQGHKVIVVDSPGLADTDMKTHESAEHLTAEIASILAIQPDGFNAILIVIRFDVRLTPEDVQICETLDVVFGQNFCEHYGIVVVTHVDAYDPGEHRGLPVEESLKKEDGGLFQRMLEKCNNRMVCIDNKTKDGKVRKKQLMNLLTMTAKMKKMSAGYKSETFEKAKKSRDEALLKEKESIIQQDTEDELSLILQEYADIPRDCTNVQKFEQIRTKLQSIRDDLIEQDNGTNVLRKMILLVSSWQITIESIITSIIERGDHDEKMEKAEQEIKSLKEELEKNRKIKTSILIGVMGGLAVGVCSLALCLGMPPLGVAVAATTLFVGRAITSVGENKEIDYLRQKKDKNKKTERR